MNASGKTASVAPPAAASSINRHALANGRRDLRAERSASLPAGVWCGQDPRLYWTLRSPVAEIFAFRRAHLQHMWMQDSEEQ